MCGTLKLKHYKFEAQILNRELDPTHLEFEEECVWESENVCWCVCERERLCMCARARKCVDVRLCLMVCVGE